MPKDNSNDINDLENDEFLESVDHDASSKSELV